MNTLAGGLKNIGMCDEIVESQNRKKKLAISPKEL